MKAILKYSFFVLGAFIFATSCEDNRLDDMAEDQIYLVKSGLQQAQVYNFGSYDFELTVYKSGYGSKEATLEFSTDQTMLNSYNESNGTSYQILPSNCYSFKSNMLNMSSSTLSDKYIVTFNTEEVLKLQLAGGQYVLPLKMKAVNDISLKEAKTDVLLIPEVSEPYLYFTTPGLSQTTAISVSDPDQFNINSQVQTNYKNSWDLSYVIEPDAQALTDYNAEKNTSYKMLPENVFSLDSKTFALNANESTREIPVTIIKKNLVSSEGMHMFGDYILPLRIKSASKYGVDPEKSLQLLRFSYLPDLLSRQGWEVIDWNSCISEESHYGWLNRTPDKMLDDDVSTFWGSKWDEPKPLPYYFIIDMKSIKNVFRVGFTKPNDSWRGNMKKGYFEISSDQQQWTKLVDWDLASNAPRTHIFDVTASKGRYLRMVITEAFDHANNAVGAASGARMDISEINVWGLNEE